MLEVIWDGQVPDDEQAENEESADSHRPAKADFGKQVDHHYWEDDAPRDERVIAKSPTITRLLWKYVMG